MGFSQGFSQRHKTTFDFKLLSYLLLIINGDGGCSFWQPVQADSQPKSSGLVLGRRLLCAILHSSNEPGELSQWLCHDDSTMNIVLVIIIISGALATNELPPLHTVMNCCLHCAPCGMCHLHLLLHFPSPCFLGPASAPLSL